MDHPVGNAGITVIPQFNCPVQVFNLIIDRRHLEGRRIQQGQPHDSRIAGRLQTRTQVNTGFGKAFYEQAAKNATVQAQNILMARPVKTAVPSPP